MVELPTGYSRIELYYHRIEHDIYKRLIEQLHRVNIYDIHELILVVPAMEIPQAIFFSNSSSYLMIMKDNIRHSIFPRHSIGPQFPHEEYLIGIFRWIFALFGLLNPLLSTTRDHGMRRMPLTVKCRTKSKKKSPSGTLITLSRIFTNRLNPSLDWSLSRSAIFRQKSFARVDESTSKASEVSSGKYTL